ncbi:MAG: amidase family protein [Phycisphaerae bacterium]
MSASSKPSPAHAIRDAVRERRSSAVAEVSAALARIDAIEPALRFALHVCRDDALSKAQALDERLARGERLGPLAGVPIVIKDNLCTTFAPTTCASRILAGFRPPYDADVVERIEAAGGVVVAKTNLDEFAMGSSTENSGVTPVRNPWDVERVPGGSSGGSAAAVAARVVPLALGSDTGGSVRQPASMCGVCGLKPTYGARPRYGLVAFASSLDQIGPLATDARDSALLLSIIAGRDEPRLDQRRSTVPDYSAACDRPITGLGGSACRRSSSATACCPRWRKRGRRPWPSCRGFKRDAGRGDAAAHAGVRGVLLHRLHGRGVEQPAAIRRRALRPSQRGGDYVSVYTRSRAEGFGDEVKRRIMLGTYALSSGYYDAYYRQALKVRTRIRDDFIAAFEQCDVIAGPAAPTPAFRLGEKSSNPLEMYLADIYTVSANLAGVPGVSIPAGLTSGGLPIGLQILGQHFDEETLLAIAAAYQRQTDWHRRTPGVCAT